MVKRQKEAKSKELEISLDDKVKDQDWETASVASTAACSEFSERFYARKHNYIPLKLIKTIQGMGKIRRLSKATIKSLNLIEAEIKSPDSKIRIKDYFDMCEMHNKRKYEAIARSFLMGRSKTAILSVVCSLPETPWLKEVWTNTVDETMKAYAFELFRFPKRNIEDIPTNTERLVYKEVKRRYIKLRDVICDWAIVFKLVPVSDELMSKSRERLFPGKNYRFFNGECWYDNLSRTYVRMRNEILELGSDYEHGLNQMRAYTIKCRKRFRNEMMELGVWKKQRLVHQKWSIDFNVRRDRYEAIYDIVRKSRELFVRRMALTQGFEPPNEVILEVPFPADPEAVKRIYNIKVTEDAKREKRLALLSDFDAKQHLLMFSSCLKLTGHYSDAAVIHLMSQYPEYSCWFELDHKSIWPAEYPDIRKELVRRARSKRFKLYAMKNKNEYHEFEKLKEEYYNSLLEEFIGNKELLKEIELIYNQL